MSTRPVSTPTSCGTPATPSAGTPPPEPKVPAAGAHPVARASLEDGLDAEVALAKGPASENVDVELFAASARIDGDQFTLQAGLSKIDIHTADRRQSISTEKLTFKVNGSTTNPDGSVGGNAAIGATLVGVEGTLTVPGGGSSVTGGLSIGVGAELGVGTRDFDKDGRTELCARVSFLVATVGLCLENPF
jgi:hypothetical protein